jgi:hypothetical protein
MNNNRKTDIRVSMRIEKYIKSIIKIIDYLKAWQTTKLKWL